MNKIEGDKTTPKGTFKIGNLYYRKDRVKKPETKLKCIEIRNRMGWCNDINQVKKYNRLIKFIIIRKYYELYKTWTGIGNEV